MPSALWPVNLRCEFAVNPKSVSVQQPRLHWNLESTQRGSRPLAYQILVASSTTKLRGDEGDLWDTGRINAPDVLHAWYKGKPLDPGQRVAWKVRVWDPQNRLSRWSMPAAWEMVESASEPALATAPVKSAATFTCGNPILTPIRDSITRTLVDRLIRQFPERLRTDGSTLAAEWAALSDAVLLEFEVPALLPVIVSGLAGLAGDESISPPGSAASLALPTVLLGSHRWFGERRWITENYSCVSQGIAAVESAVRDNSWLDDLGDPGCTTQPHAETHACLFASRWAGLACELAQLAGDDASARRTERLRLRINNTILARHPELLTGAVAPELIGPMALAISWDVMPADQHVAATQRLIEAARGENMTLDAGVFGATAILDVLAAAGQGDLAYRILCQFVQTSDRASKASRSPLRGRISTRSATTTTLAPAVTGLEPRQCMANAWLMRWLGGLQLPRDAAGCDKVILAPQTVPGMNWAKVVFDSVRGEVIVSWKRRGNLLLVDVTVPSGLLAVTHVPTREPGSVAEGSRSVLVSREIHTVVPSIYRIVAGEYNFTALAPVDDPS